MSGRLMMTGRGLYGALPEENVRRIIIRLTNFRYHFSFWRVV
ncbi:hypothetical protein RHCRD62_50271 [Rhodococcus sp. RD6.2]|nr:hypothetical protein RHCRD62_50271 [Rhodococcus sp. RD6.2]